jgi:hypothetical protein
VQESALEGRSEVVKETKAQNEGQEIQDQDYKEGEENL